MPRGKWRGTKHFGLHTHKYAHTHTCQVHARAELGVIIEKTKKKKMKESKERQERSASNRGRTPGNGRFSERWSQAGVFWAGALRAQQGRLIKSLARTNCTQTFITFLPQTSLLPFASSVDRVGTIFSCPIYDNGKTQRAC